MVGRHRPGVLAYDRASGCSHGRGDLLSDGVERADDDIFTFRSQWSVVRYLRAAEIGQWLRCRAGRSDQDLPGAGGPRMPTSGPPWTSAP